MKQKHSAMAVIIYTAVLITLFSLVSCGNNEETTTAGSNTSSDQLLGVIANVGDNTMTVTTGRETVTFDISTATIISDSSSVLRVGKIVTVDGTISGTSSKADKIHYDSEVEGHVLSISLDANNEVVSLVVMGQTVFVDDMTVYEDGLISSADITIGMNVEVSGFFTDTGILAKYIELKDADDLKSEIKGFVSGIPEGATEVDSFMIGECTINIDPNTTTFDGFEFASEIMNGMKVEVKFDFVEMMPNICAVTASKIELEDMDKDFNNSKVDGIVSSVPENNRFTMSDKKLDNDVTIVISENTVFKNGIVANILIGVRLKVKGIYNIVGELEANSIKIYNPIQIPMLDMVKIDAYIETIDITAGTITVLGRQLTINEMTMFSGNKAYVDASAGDFVKIKAVNINDNLVVKHIIIKMLDFNEIPRSKIEGIATLDANILKVEGVIIVAPFLDPANQVIVNGDRVAVTGSYDVSTMELTADSVKIKSKN